MALNSVATVDSARIIPHSIDETSYTLVARFNMYAVRSTSCYGCNCWNRSSLFDNPERLCLYCVSDGRLCEYRQCFRGWLDRECGFGPRHSPAEGSTCEFGSYFANFPGVRP